MEVLWTILRVGLAASIVVTVAELSQRFPRQGALLLSLPILSIVAFAFSWVQHHDLPAISRMARGTLVLVPLGLPFFVPLAFGERFGLSFWPCFIAGILMAALTTGSWLHFMPVE